MKLEAEHEAEDEDEDEASCSYGFSLDTTEPPEELSVDASENPLPTSAL